jgi:hypothetical protein
MTKISNSTSRRLQERHKTSAILNASAFILGLLIFAWAPSEAMAQTTPLPDGKDGEKYVGYKIEFRGGTKPITCSLKSGSRPLPPGIVLDPSGCTLTGSPTSDPAPGTARPFEYDFDIEGTDSALGPHKIVTSYSLKIVQNDPLTVFVPSPPPLSPPFALSISTSDEETIDLTQRVDPSTINGVNKNTLEITNADSLIASTIETDPNNPQFSIGDYCVIHLIRWKKQDSAGKADPAKETWALLERINENGNAVWVRRFDPKDKDKLTYDSRIFGSKRVVVLLLHYDTPATWDVKYKISINQEIPTPIANVLSLAKVVVAEARVQGEEPETKTIWGARLLLIKYKASTIVVKVNTVTADEDGNPVEQSKEYTKTYTNEGRYRWDVSVGVPVTTIRELQFSTDSSNRVTTAGKDRQNVYGFLNIFPKPVDLSGEKFLTVPHFVFGVPLASKPLQHPFAGIGYGVYKSPIKFNLFAGIVFNRERVPRTLNVGSSATSSQLEADLQTRWVRKFMFGINFPIKQITDAIKKK